MSILLSSMNGHALSIEQMRQSLSVPLLCDALDAAGLTRQSPRLPISPITVRDHCVIGRAKTTLWADMAHRDPEPYKLELEAIDSTEPDDIIVCAANGSTRSGIWGELLSTAAAVRGCAGVLVDGMVRDVTKMREMGFPVFARGQSPYDSQNRQRVTNFDVTIELDGVMIQPGDLIAMDEDGIVVVPQHVEAKVVQAAWEKSQTENQVRNAVAGGMSATQAYAKYGVL